MRAAILYLPVIHAGHLDFSQRQKPDSLYVLGETLLEEFKGKPPFLERDLRALKPDQVLAEAKAISLAPHIALLEKSNISDLKKFDEIIISDDELGDELAKKYFPDKKVIKDHTFLRWGSMKALSKEIPDNDQVISKIELDRLLINKAREISKRSPDWWRQVGSLIIKNDTVVLEGWNKHLPTNNSAYIDGDPRSSFNAGERIDLSLALHGEAGMIAEAARRGIPLEGSSIYVTTFPCPNCARMIANAGIKKVYYEEGYSLLDAAKILKNSGTEIIKVI